MITENEQHEMVPVEDLIEGDYVDLENDPYADPDENDICHLYYHDHLYYQDQYAVVRKVTLESPEITGVSFDVTDVGFPHGHKVRRYNHNDM